MDSVAADQDRSPGDQVELEEEVTQVRLGSENNARRATEELLMHWFRTTV